MANCVKCNAELEDGVKFCTACGTNQETGEQPQAQQAQPQKQAEPDLADKIMGLNNTADTTADYDKKDIEDNKFMAILAYIGILFLIPLFAAKESKFAKFHTNQGIILCIVGVAGGIIGIIPILGTIVSAVVGLATTVLMVLGIVNVCQGKAKELPIIGKYKILK